MGDDFDLFPKRENLDPFSFGKKEKTADSDKPEAGEELFGQEPQAPVPPPDLPIEMPPDLTSDLTPDLPPGLPVDPPVTPPSLPDLPLSGPDSAATSPEPGMPPIEPPPHSSDTTMDAMDRILSDGPISEEKTFDEPVFEQKYVVEDSVETNSRKSPSPFVVIGGALIIIIGLLYGALTYLKKDKPLAPAATAPAVSVPVLPTKPEPVPVPVPEVSQPNEQSETQLPVEAAKPAQGEVTKPDPAADVVTETVVVTTPATGSGSVPSQVEGPNSKPVPVVAAGSVEYSVQVGAFILDSSVADLEKRLRGLGYDPFLKKGSTTAMMNMLTVGPFAKVDEARTALSRLKDAGVDSNMRRRNDGGAIINAGSYLLEENATNIMKKVRSLGYPVKLFKKEARLPMTFVRVGRFPDKSEADSAKTELKGKGLEGIVVKL